MPSKKKNKTFFFDQYVTATKGNLHSIEQRRTSQIVVLVLLSPTQWWWPKRPQRGYDELPYARTTAENHRGQVGHATGDLQTQFYPPSLSPATAVNSQGCFLASVVEPLWAPDPLTYSSSRAYASILPPDLFQHPHSHMGISFTASLQSLYIHPSLLCGFNSFISSNSVW